MTTEQAPKTDLIDAVFPKVFHKETVANTVSGILRRRSLDVKAQLQDTALHHFRKTAIKGGICTVTQ
ncbi:hypothetical protein ACWIYZ_07735 [Ursidibacter arcticus]